MHFTILQGNKLAEATLMKALNSAELERKMEDLLSKIKNVWKQHMNSKNEL